MLGSAPFSFVPFSDSQVPGIHVQVPITGFSSTLSLGAETVDTEAKVTATNTGLGATSALGTVVTRFGVSLDVNTIDAAVTAVGTVNVDAENENSVTGVVGTTAIGAEVVNAGAKVFDSTVATVTTVSDVSVIGIGVVNVTGVVGTTAVGAEGVDAEAIVTETGLGLVASIGTISSISAEANITGLTVLGTSILGEVFSWDSVNDAQSIVWTPVAN